MSLKRKAKTVAGNQVVDNTLPINSLNCTSNDFNMSGNSPLLVPTQQAVMTYVQTHAQEFVLEGLFENPTDNDIAIILEARGLTLNEGDTFLYIQVDNDNNPINSKKLTYSGFGFQVTFEQQPQSKAGESFILPARNNIGGFGDGFTRDIVTGGTGVFTANNADSTDVFFIDASTKDQQIGRKYKISLTTANQQNTNGINLKVYYNDGTGIDGVDPILDVITATTDGTHEHEFIGVAGQNHFIVFYGNNTTLNVTALDMFLPESTLPHVIHTKIPTAATYTYELFNRYGLGDPGVTFTATNDGVLTTDSVEFRLYRPLHIIGVSRVTVRVTATYDTTINVGGVPQAVTATTFKDYHMRVEN